MRLTDLIERCGAVEATDNTFISRQTSTVPCNGADYYLPGYFVADAFTAYKMKLQYPVTLQLNVKNVLGYKLTSPNEHKNARFINFLNWTISDLTFCDFYRG